MEIRIGFSGFPFETETTRLSRLKALGFPLFQVTTTVTTRLGKMVRYWLVWNIVTVPEYVPLHWVAPIRQRAVKVTAVNDGPQGSGPLGLTERLILFGMLTLVLSVVLGTSGAHLKEFPTLPELAVSALPEKAMVTGFVIQRVFGDELEARTTAA